EHEAAVLAAEDVGPLGLHLAVPLVEARRRDETTSRLEGGAERGLGRLLFAPGVDRARAELQVRRTERDQPPAQEGEFSAAVRSHAYDRRALCRGDVPQGKPDRERGAVLV